MTWTGIFKSIVIYLLLDTNDGGFLLLENGGKIVLEESYKTIWSALEK